MSGVAWQKGLDRTEGSEGPAFQQSLGHLVTCPEDLILRGGWLGPPGQNVFWKLES